MLPVSLFYLFFFLLPPNPLSPGQSYLASRGGGGVIKARRDGGVVDGVDPRVVGVEGGRFVAPVPLVMRWSLIDLSMWSHLAQKDGAPTCSRSLGGRRGGGVGGSRRRVGLHTHDTHSVWDFMILSYFFTSVKDKVCLPQLLLLNFWTVLHGPPVPPSAPAPPSTHSVTEGTTEPGGADRQTKRKQTHLLTLTWGPRWVSKDQKVRGADGPPAQKTRPPVS